LCRTQAYFFLPLTCCLEWHCVRITACIVCAVFELSPSLSIDWIKWVFFVFCVPVPVQNPGSLKLRGYASLSYAL
jgi:hypothetical protein